MGDPVKVEKEVLEGFGRLLADTYGGFLASRQYPGWRTETERKVQETLSHMLKLGLVEQEGEDVRLTLLGRACGQSSMVLSSAMRLVELLKAAGARIARRCATNS